MDWHRQNDEKGRSSLLCDVGFAILRSVAMQREVKCPHRSDNSGQSQVTSVPRPRSIASRDTFHPCAGCGFCK